MKQALCLALVLLAGFHTMAADNAAEDSVSILPALLDRAQGPLREAIVHHSIHGRFSIRQGNWKLALCPGSGGWSAPLDPPTAAQGLPSIQLNDMSIDIGAQANQQSLHPEVVARLTRLLGKYVADGRSTPGKPQSNTVVPDIWKSSKDKAASRAK